MKHSTDDTNCPQCNGPSPEISEKLLTDSRFCSHLCAIEWAVAVEKYFEWTACECCKLPVIVPMTKLLYGFSTICLRCNLKKHMATSQNNEVSQ